MPALSGLLRSALRSARGTDSGTAPDLSCEVVRVARPGKQSATGPKACPKPPLPNRPRRAADRGLQLLCQALAGAGAVRAPSSAAQFVQRALSWEVLL